MNYWNELDGSTFFNKIFTFPVLIGEIELFSINIDNNRPTVIIEFDIPDFPDSPPEKWKRSGFNTCRIGINCSNIENLTMKNIPNKKKMSVKISKKDEQLVILFFNDEAVIEFCAKHTLLCGPSGYIN